MIRTRTILFLGLLVSWLPGFGRAQGDGGGVEPLIRLLGPELRRIEG
jgi:hypothetical protein